MSVALFIQAKQFERGIAQPRFCIAGDNVLNKRGDRTTAKNLNHNQLEA